MRFTSIAATLAAVSSVSALPQKLVDSSAKPAEPLPLQVFADTPKFITPLSLEEAKKKFEGVASNRVMNLMAAPAAAAAAPTCANPRKRVEWDSYPDTDKQAFVDAIKCLMKKPSSGGYPGATSRYEDLVSLHQSLTPTVHGNDIFLLWHRYYIWTFEDMLRQECGFTRDLPWWNEAKWAGKFNASSIFSAKWFGSVDVKGACVADGQFPSSTFVLNIGAGPRNSRHCLSRNFNARTTMDAGQNYVDYCNSLPDFHNMAQCSEGGPHAQGHNGIGGVMSDPYASPSDPLFWMHHQFVDRSYQVWQAQNPARMTSISGRDANRKTITLDTQIAIGGLRPAVKVSDLLNTQSQTLCYQYVL